VLHKRLKFIGLAVLVSMSVGCDRASSGLAGIESSPAAPAHTVTVFDGASTTLTLDLVAGTVSDDAGRQLVLTPDEAAAIFAAEDHTREFEWDLFEAESYSEPPDACTQPNPTEPCAEVREASSALPIGGGSAVTPPMPNFLRMRPVLDRRGRPITRGFRRVPLGFGADTWQRPAAGASASIDLALSPALLSDFTCANVMQEIWRLREHARPASRAFVGTVVRALAENVGVGQSGVSVDITNFGQDLEVALATAYVARTQLSMLMAFARSMQCYSYTYYGGTHPAQYYQPNLSQPPRGIYVRTCGMALWTVTKADGTSEDIWIETCITTYEPLEM